MWKKDEKLDYLGLCCYILMIFGIFINNMIKSLSRFPFAFRGLLSCLLFRKRLLFLDAQKFDSQIIIKHHVNQLFN